MIIYLRDVNRLISIDCVKEGMLPDILYDRVLELIENKIVVVEEHYKFYREQYTMQLEKGYYEIVKTDYITKLSVDYLYSLKH